MGLGIKTALQRLFYQYCPGRRGWQPYCGTRVYFDPGSILLRVLQDQGAFEPHIQKCLCQLAQPGSTVLDVGANVGLMAVPVLQAKPDCQVVSFEPSPSSVPYLKKTWTHSPYRQRWIIREVALSHQPGQVEFCLAGRGDSAYEGLRSGPRVSQAKTTTVQANTLDQEWEQLHRPSVSVIKIDVEGGEWQVLLGGPRLFDTCRPALILEWYEDYLKEFGTAPQELLKFALQRSYRLYSLPAGIEVADAVDLRVQMMLYSNFVLLPRQTL
jgi:FkbM family methyltransferase